MSQPLSAVAVDRLAARNLCRLRRRASFSASRLALALGIHINRVTDIEQGRARLPVDVLVAAAAVLAVPLERFFEDAPGAEVAQ